MTVPGPRRGICRAKTCVSTNCSARGVLPPRDGTSGSPIGVLAPQGLAGIVGRRRREGTKQIAPGSQPEISWRASLRNGCPRSELAVAAPFV